MKKFLELNSEDQKKEIKEVASKLNLKFDIV